MTVRSFTRSFAGGEISPEMVSRIDDARYQTGARLLQNMVPRPHGPALRRPGTEFVALTVDNNPVVPVPFRIGATAGIILEVGVGYIRFHSQGAPLQARAYVPSRTVTFNNVTGEVFFSVPHGLREDDPVAFTTSGTLPSPIPVGLATRATTLYATIVDAQTIQLKTIAGSIQTSLTGLTGGSGTHTCHFGYFPGFNVISSPSQWRCGTAHINSPPPSAPWSVVTSDTNPSLQLNTAFSAKDLANLQWDQFGPVISLVFGTRGLLDLAFLADSQWDSNTVTFSANLAAPTGLTAAKTLGVGLSIKSVTNTTPTPAVFETGISTGTPHTTDHNLSSGDSVLVTGVNPSGLTIAGVGVTLPRFFNVQRFDADQFELVDPTTGVKVAAASTTVDTTMRVRPVSLSSDSTNSYKVTAVTEDGNESQPSAQHDATDNNLFASGAKNDLTWNAVPGAVRYRVYKKQRGVFGLIGEPETNSFTDDNIGPDLKSTVPYFDTLFATNPNFPTTVARFQQRRVVARGQVIAFTVSGTESDMSFHLPVIDSDRIRFELPIKDGGTIKHVVAMNELIVLADTEEIRVTPTNSDVLTPTTFDARPQTSVGSSSVRPIVVNNSLLFVASRGYHLRELGFSANSGGYISGDLHLRAGHLVDGFQIVDQAVSRTPHQLVWQVRSDGLLTCLTFVPEEQIGGWHRHPTDGVVKRIAVIPEGNEDRLYLVVVRNGAQMIERLGSMERQTIVGDPIEEKRFVDSSLQFDGRNTSSVTMTVQNGRSWGPGEPLTIVASSATFSSGDVGDQIVLIATDGSRYRLTITTFVSTTKVFATVDVALPAAFQNVATTSWGFARDTFSGFTHLNGKTIQVFAEGVDMGDFVVSGGAFTLPSPKLVVQAGLGYTSEIRPLPLVLPFPDVGIGRPKAINRAHVRAIASSPFQMGPAEDKLVTAGAGVLDGEEEIEVEDVLRGHWSHDGDLIIRQSRPLPLNIIGIGLEVQYGGGDRG